MTEVPHYQVPDRKNTRTNKNHPTKNPCELVFECLKIQYFVDIWNTKTFIITNNCLVKFLNEQKELGINLE